MSSALLTTEWLLLLRLVRLACTYIVEANGLLTRGMLGD